VYTIIKGVFAEMKKLLAVLLAAVFTLPQSLFLTVSAAETAPLPVSRMGTIAEMSDTQYRFTADSGEEIVLNVSPQTYVADAATGAPAALNDRTNDHVIAYYSAAMTRSMPPQSNAVLILCNVPAGEDGLPPANMPLYWRVESLEAGEGSVRVTVDGGGLFVTIPQEAPISPFLTKNIAVLDDIEVGSDLLLWYPFVAESFPAQATADKTVILGKAAPAGQPDAQADGGVDEAVLTLNKADTLIIDDVLTVPLRLVAEAAGYAVEWDDASKTARIDGKDEITVSAADENLASYNVGNRIYIAAAAAEKLFNLILRSDEETVSFTTAE
jgi:hypothetical protein